MSGMGGWMDEKVVGPSLEKNTWSTPKSSEAIALFMRPGRSMVDPESNHRNSCQPTLLPIVLTRPAKQ